MNKFRVTVLFLLFALALTVGLVFAQSGTPPPPTPTPIPICPPALQETCDWVGPLVSAYGLWAVLAAVGLAVAVWFWQRAQKVVDSKTEKTLEKIWEDAETADKVPAAARAYLEKVIESYARFSFRGLEAVGRGIKVPEFDHAYISLQLRPETERAAKTDGPDTQHDKSREFLTEGRLGERGLEPLDLTEAIRQSPRLAIVGAAGSGKSTLLQWAGLAAARVWLKKEKPSEEQSAFVKALGAPRLLPVLVALRDFNLYCRNENRARTPAALLDFLTAHFAEQYPSLELPAGFWETQLKASCLMMFDGVDEVDPADRPRVREAIEGFVQNFGSERNRYLVTARTVAYTGAVEVTDFRRCEVQNLAPDQRDALIHFWCRAAYPVDEAEREAAKLCQRIETSDAQVRDLAVTPLMVSIFAVVHYGRRELPRQRAELYENAVQILLTEEHHGGEAARSLREWAHLSPETRRDRLARIAYELHTLNRDALPEAELVEVIWSDFGSDQKTAQIAARDFIRLVAQRGGLLEEDNGEYGFFTHRTFREFLAGRYLAQELEDDWPARLLERLDNDQWLEVTRLAAGFLAFANATKADKFIRLLAGLGLTADARARALTWAGLALADFPADRVRAETQNTLAEDLRAALTANPPLVSAVLRRAIGLALAALGDPRFPAHPEQSREAAQSKDAPGSKALPALVSIPPGPFRMGTSDIEAEKLKAQNAESWPDEKPQHTVFVSEFAIGKYPVTNAEYRLFVEAKGYEQETGWSPDGWRWRTGQLEADLSIYTSEDRKKVADWLKRRPVEKRYQPFFWDDPQWNAANLPVVGVTWYEAQAYCLWLTDKLRAVGAMAPTEEIRLPTEAEWEKAARCEVPTSSLQLPISRLWPWGDDWDPDKCNSSESGFNATTPVGMYPHGASALGVQDMVGNVWEWCADWWDEDLYSKRADQETRDPIGPAGGSARVIRGGSWSGNRGACRSAYRSRYDPAFFFTNCGLRVVRSPVRT